MSEIEQLKAENERLKEEIDFLKREDEYSTKLIKRIQNDLLKSDRINDNLEVENKRLKRELSGKRFICPQCMEFAKEIHKYQQTLQEIKAIAEPFAKCYTHTCRNCDKYDNAHACCIKDIHCYKYNVGSNSSCKDFVLPTKRFYQQILANIITKAEEE